MLMNYRIRPDSRQQALNYAQLLHMYDLISHDYAHYYQEHAVDLINLLLANGPPFVWNHPAADWKSPLVHLEELNHRYRVELDSQDFVTRHFIRLTLSNLKKTLKHPGRAWQKFLKWYRIYFDKNKV